MAGIARNGEIMGFGDTGDKTKHAAEVAGGKLKEGAGKLTGDEKLQAEGEGDQASGKVKQAGDKVADAAKDAFGGN